MSKIKCVLDIVNDLRNLADSIEVLVAAMEGHAVEKEQPIAEQNKTAVNKKAENKATEDNVTEDNAAMNQPATDEPTTDQQTANQPTANQKTANELTLEEVRAVLADKNKEGHREAVKAIIFKYGANKLTALDPKYYVDVLKEVGEIK